MGMANARSSRSVILAMARSPLARRTFSEVMSDVAAQPFICALDDLQLVSALRLYEHTQGMEISPVALAPLFWRIAKENERDAQENGIDMRLKANAGSGHEQPCASRRYPAQP